MSQEVPSVCATLSLQIVMLFRTGLQTGVNKILHHSDSERSPLPVEVKEDERQCIQRSPLLLDGSSGPPGDAPQHDNFSGTPILTCMSPGDQQAWENLPQELLPLCHLYWKLHAGAMRHHELHISRVSCFSCKVIGILMLQKYDLICIWEELLLTDSGYLIYDFHFISWFLFGFSIPCSFAPRLVLLPRPQKFSYQS